MDRDRAGHMSWGVEDVEFHSFSAYVDNIGQIDTFSTLEEAKKAVKETIEQSGRADPHGYVMEGEEVVWEVGSNREEDDF